MRKAENVPVRDAQYFSFGEIAEKVATGPGSMVVDNQSLDRAYRELYESAVNSSFSCMRWWKDGRDIEYPAPLLAEAKNDNEWSSFRDNWMRHIRVPREDVRRWFGARSITLPPEWFPTEDRHPAGNADGTRGMQQDGERYKTLYEERVKNNGGSLPPIQTTKGGIEGDREWAVRVGVPRSLLKYLRDLYPKPSLGRRKNSAKNSAE